MAIIPSVTNSVATWDNYASPQSANRTDPVVVQSRESELARQLENSLSTRLNRIRNSIAPAEETGSTAAGNSRTLDISA